MPAFGTVRPDQTTRGFFPLSVTSLPPLSADMKLVLLDRGPDRDAGRIGVPMFLSVSV